MEYEVRAYEPGDDGLSLVNPGELKDISCYLTLSEGITSCFRYNKPHPSIVTMGELTDEQLQRVSNEFNRVATILREERRLKLTPIKKSQ